MQQERLKALGQMASGIAHDINNAISPVALYTESLLETEPSLSARARDYLETIQRANEDVAQTVARMREFYRPREAEMVLSTVDLNDVAQRRHQPHARPLERHAAGARRRWWSSTPRWPPTSRWCRASRASCAKRSPTWCSTPWTRCRRAAR